MWQIVLMGFRLFAALKNRKLCYLNFLVMKLKRLKLSDLSDKSLKDKEMNALRGGNLDGCHCSCYWENQGGSSSDDNMTSNYSRGDGTHSAQGCNQHWMVGSGIMDCNDCNENKSGYH